MDLTEKYKEAIRRVIKADEERGTGPVLYAPEDWAVYSYNWEHLKNEMCRRAGVTGAITANMVTERLRTMAIRRVSRYERVWVI